MSSAGVASAAIPTFDLPTVTSSRKLIDALRLNGIIQRRGLFRRERFVWVAPGEAWPAGSLDFELTLLDIAASGSRTKLPLWSATVEVGDLLDARRLHLDSSDPRTPEWSLERGEPYYAIVCRYRVVQSLGSAS